MKIEIPMNSSTGKHKIIAASRIVFFVFSNSHITIKTLTHLLLVFVNKLVRVRGFTVGIRRKKTKVIKSLTVIIIIITRI